VVPQPDAADASLPETSPPPQPADAAADAAAEAAGIDASSTDGAVVRDAAAADAVAIDAAPPPSACVLACAAMVAAGCVQLPTCATTLAAVEAHHMVLDPTVKGSANWLTCTALKGVKTAAQVQAHGWSCGPAGAH